MKMSDILNPSLLKQYENKKKTLKIFTLLKSFESSPAPYYHEILADIIFDQWGTIYILVHLSPSFKPSLMK